MPLISRKLETSVNIENVTEWSTNHFSMADPFNLEMSLWTRSEDDIFHVGISCPDPTRAKQWSMRIEFHVSICSSLNSNKIPSKSGSIQFPENTILAYYDIDDLLHQLSESITLTLKLEIIETKGFCLAPSYDFSVSEKLTDVVLVVEKKEFHLNKAVLATFSPYFESMFSSNFKEAHGSKIRIEEVAASSFQILLDFMYHHSSVTGQCNGVDEDRTGREGGVSSKSERPHRRNQNHAASKIRRAHAISHHIEQPRL